MGLLNIGTMVGVIPIKTWERMGLTIDDLIPTYLRLAAMICGAIYGAKRTPVRVLQMRGSNVKRNFLVSESLDNTDQLNLGRDFPYFDITFVLSKNKQVCLVTNMKTQVSVILGVFTSHEKDCV